MIFLIFLQIWENQKDCFYDYFVNPWTALAALTVKNKSHIWKKNWGTGINSGWLLFYHYFTIVNIGKIKKFIGLALSNRDGATATFIRLALKNLKIVYCI